ncbi:hypothetical protein V2J09_023580 [Rumex salicifolius]
MILGPGFIPLNPNFSCSFSSARSLFCIQSPGKPKEILSRARKYEDMNKSNMAYILPLKPPPIRLRHSRDSSSNQGEEEDDQHDVDDDDGCDGDVDEIDEDVDFFSGGLDLFSLAESSDNAMVTKNVREVAKKVGAGRRAPPTPSFMMERFLPAAVALAAESLEAQCTQNEEEAAETPRVAGGGERRVLPPITSPLAFKSCGLENLLPWWARPKKNVVKGPIKFGCSDWKTQLSPRPK